VLGRIDIEADDIFDLFSEGRVVGVLKVRTRWG
jgi:hypothetical protein